jgi:hypothetical protein
MPSQFSDVLKFGSVTIFFSLDNEALVGEGLIIEASRAQSDTPHSVGLLWMSDQSVAKAST